MNELAGTDPRVSDKLSSRRQHHKHQILNFDSSDSTSIMSMNKKVIVEHGQPDQISSIKLVDIDFGQLKNVNSPEIFLIGGYGTDPNTELTVSKYKTKDETIEDLGFTCGRVKSCSVRLPNGSI